MKLKTISSIVASALVCSASYADGERTLNVVNFTEEPLTVDGALQVTGAGGLRLPSLSLGANARLTIDPVRTPVSVAGAPSFASGAKIALANRYAGVSRGRFVLATWSGDAAVPADLFETNSVAGKSVAAVEKAPDGVCSQLVVTVGDFSSSPTVRILAIGDSITQGIQKEEQPEYGYPQYRTSLAAFLAANGVKAVMVGTRDMSRLDAAGVQAPQEWTHHYGCSGITTGGLLDNKANWVNSGETPDYVTLLIGTNDIHGKRKASDRGVAAREVFDSWKKLVDEIAARWPKAKILGSTILDRDFYNEGEVGHDFTVRINNIIKAELQAGNLPGNYQLVDLYEKCPLAEEGVFFNDKLHPNWKGQMAMAEAFFEAVATNAATFSAVSPDGKNEIRLETGYGGMRYSVRRGGKTIVEPIKVSLTLEGHGQLDGRGANPTETKSRLSGTLATPIYKKSSIDLAANVTRVGFGGWAFAMCARNDGVAWRFETEFDGEATVTAENTDVRFPNGTELCYGQVDGFQTGFETLSKFGSVESVTPGVSQLVITPFTATVPGAGVVCVTESDLLDYPGLNFHRNDGEADTLRSWQAGVPSETERRERLIRVKNRHSYLAKTDGRRTYPWRVFVLGDTPSDLVESDAVYALASPSSSTDFSWVRPGLVQWDWWHGFQITDVPGLATGCNYDTYKAYIDFAAANGIPYIIMDEGWSENLNLDNPRAEVNVEGVIKYGRDKGVGVILWAAWPLLADAADRARVFDRYAAMGAKGFKIDFMERDDQELEKFLENTAADAAARKLVVMYHGIHKPTGLQRAYPNILNYEGVYGLEQGRGRGGRKMPPNDCTLPYTRMVAGMMDYTPGAMRNRVFDAPDAEAGAPAACYGTRCHQLALFPIFEAPVQMLCDSPTQYRTEPECTAFIAKVPTTWDDTVGVAGEIGKFAAVARRKGSDWWLGAIGDWTARELELPTAFLGSGEWSVEAFEDAADADVDAECYVQRKFKIKAGDALAVRLAPGGGFAARFSPVSCTGGATIEAGTTVNVDTAAEKDALLGRGLNTLKVIPAVGTFALVTITGGDTFTSGDELRAAIADGYSTDAVFGISGDGKSLMVTIGNIYDGGAINQSTPTLVFPGSTLADLATHTLRARFQGSDFDADGTEATFFNRVATEDNGVLAKVTYQLQALDDTSENHSSKAVKVEFTADASGVSAKLAGGDYSNCGNQNEFGADPLTGNPGTDDYIPYDFRLVKPVSNAISVNFTQGDNNLDTSSSVRYGAGDYAVPYSSWTNMAGSNGGTATCGGATVTMTKTSGGWFCSALSDTKDLRRGYLDDSGLTVVVDVTGIPYDLYRVVTYHASDNADKKFGCVKINETRYTGVADATVKGNGSWGATASYKRAFGFREGVNYLVSDPMSGSSVTITGHRDTSSNDNPKFRGCIAAIQIVECGTTYTATIGDGGSKSLSALSWDKTLASPLTAYDRIVVNVDEDAALDVDIPVDVHAITFNVASGKTLTLSGYSVLAQSIAANGAGQIVATGVSQLAGKVRGNCTLLFPGEPAGVDLTDWTGSRWTYDTAAQTAVLEMWDTSLRSLSAAPEPIGLSGITSWIVPVAETREEFGKGQMAAATDVPAGVSVRVIRPNGTTVDVTPVDGTATLTEAPQICGAATALDATYTNTTRYAYLAPGWNAGSGRDVAPSTYGNTGNDDTTGMYILHHPWISGVAAELNALSDFSLVVVGTMSPSKSTQFIHMGDSRGTRQGILITTTENADEVLIAKNTGATVDAANGVRAFVPNATTARHAYVIYKRGTLFEVWVDGVKRGQFDAGEGFALGTSSSCGIQVGSDHGGAIRDAGVYKAVPNDPDETGVVNLVRLFDYPISEAQAEAVFNAYPYVSEGGLFTRTVSADGTFSQTDAWEKEGSSETFDFPEGATVEGIAYNPSAALTVNAAAEIEVNASVSIETLTVGGTAPVTFTADGAHTVTVLGAAIINSPVTNEYGAVYLAGAPVQLGSSGAICFDCSGIDVSNVSAVTRFQLTGLTDRDDGKFSIMPPTAPGWSYELVYNTTGSCYDFVVTPLRHGVWSGAGMDADFETAANWEDGVVPSAGDDIDFSGVPAAATIAVAGASANTTFGTATMGSSVVTFTGNVGFANITDTSKIAVGANSTVTLDGNLEFSGHADSSTTNYVVYSVAEGGKFVVTGDIVATDGFTGANYVYPCKYGLGGAVQARGLVNNATGNNDQYAFRLMAESSGTAKWIIGDHGISGSRYFWAERQSAEIQPLDADFTISARVSDVTAITFNTTGTDGNPRMIMVGNGGSIVWHGTLNITGSGRFLVDAENSFGGTANVHGTATLAINAGKQITTGAISVSSNATLEVHESGTVALLGGLKLADDATLGFNFSETRAAPVLDVTGKTVTFGGQKQINVSLSGAHPAYSSDGKYVLTSGGKFTGASVAKADDCADWVKNFGIEDDNIYVNIKRASMMINLK